MTFEELEVALMAATSKLDLLDQVIKSERLGQPKTIAYKCGISGLYYPADYVSEWGRKYGIGLGPMVCSESLQSDYSIRPPDVTSSTDEIESIMHPVYNSKVQMDLVTEYVGLVEEAQAIVAIEDPRMKARARIIYAKQLKNPKNRLGQIRAAWLQKVGG